MMKASLYCMNYFHLLRHVLWHDFESGIYYNENFWIIKKENSFRFITILSLFKHILGLKKWIGVFKYNLKLTGHSVSVIHWIVKVSVVADGLWDRFLAHVELWECINISRVTLIYVACKILFLPLQSLTLLQMYWDVCSSQQ